MKGTRVAVVAVVLMVGCGSPSSLSSLVGKTVMVGVDLHDSSGMLVRRVQIHGMVSEADTEAVVVSMVGGKRFYLPPAPTAFRQLPKGTYRERSTGEVITDPDFVVVWSAQVEESGRASSIDWSVGMEWTRPVDFQFPGEHWQSEGAF